jgi:Fusaric acid resistance protein-like
MAGRFQFPIRPRRQRPFPSRSRLRRRLAEELRWAELLARLRARRLSRPSWSSYRGRGVPVAWRLVKTTVAAVLSYELALRLLSDPIPLLAALTAVLVAQITIFETVRSGAERIGSVVAGVLVAALLSRVVGLTWWGLAIVIFASLVIGQFLHLGQQELEVPISAMLVLAVAGQTESAALTRVLETLIGAVTGVTVNAVLGPSVYVQPAGNAIGEFADDIADLLRTMGEELTERWSSEQARAWVHRTQELDAPLRAAEAALARGEDSLRLNPRGRRVVEGTLSLRAGLAALEHAAVQVRGICRDLADLAEVIEERGEAEPEILLALGRLLVELGDGVAAFGGLVAPDIAGPPREAVPLRIQLEIARTHRDVLAELMLVDARADPDLWHIQGSLLANVDRLLREIDLERGEEARRVRRR